jgi:hypothetical protein
MSETKDRKFFGLDDVVIFQIRELIQLAMLTQTNLVDHMRQLRFEESQEKPGFLTLTPEYVQYHNNVVEGLMKQVEELTKTVTETESNDKVSN